MQKVYKIKKSLKTPMILGVLISIPVFVDVFQRGYEHTGGLSQTLMGARTYLPALGMFTATDPVAGGNTTTYTYPQDPINKRDYTGTMLSDGPSGSTLNIPLSLPGWKPFNPQRGDSKRGTFQESRTYKIIQAAVGVYSFRTLISSIGWLGERRGRPRYPISPGVWRRNC